MGVHKQKVLTANKVDRAMYLHEKKSRKDAEKLLKLKIHELYLINRDIQEKTAALKTAETQLHQVQEELKQLSSIDILTHVANRTQLDSDLKREVARAKRYSRQLALLHLDLDFFKKINEKFGHDVGDALLQVIAARLKSALRAEDLIARLGGDEFAIILTEISNPHDAGLVAHRIVEKMSEPLTVMNHSIIIGASIGIACYPDAGTDPVALQKSADIALKCTKSCGRNNYQFYTSDLQNIHNYRLELEADLHFALEKNEFFLVYQPRLDTKSGDMVGIEVLLRWRQATRGIISPNEFISLAEETGLIIPIGEWILKTACAQFAAWRAQNKNFTCSLALNISPRQLQQKSFIDAVKQTLIEYEIPPHLLELEMTESAIISYLGKIEDTLFQLRHLGVRFSIDDFGTGFSSLERLKELPIQSIKIDRTLVSEIDSSDNIMLKSTIELGKNMGINVIAKGVETESQLQFLASSQCPEAQGYLCGKPLSADQMNQLLTKKSK